MIEAINLSKYYGDFLAVQDVTFKVSRGEIVGFLGPNGAGKTTTMRMLVGFLPASSGTAKIAGYDIHADSLKARRNLGYLPESVPLDNDMTVKAYLRFFAILRGMGAKLKDKRIQEVMDLMQLREYCDTLIGKLSKGYRQRVGLAQAILHDPQVLILDEPTIGIDPRQVAETRQLIKELRENHTILLSSHILSEVSLMCNRVIIMDQGRIVAIDQAEKLAERLQGGQRIELEVIGPVDDILSRLEQVKGIWQVNIQESASKRSFRVECPPGKDIRDELAAVIVQSGWKLQELKSCEMSLEDIFLKLTRNQER